MLLPSPVLPTRLILFILYFDLKISKLWQHEWVTRYLRIYIVYTIDKRLILFLGSLGFCFCSSFPACCLSHIPTTDQTTDCCLCVCIYRIRMYIYAVCLLFSALCLCLSAVCCYSYFSVCLDSLLVINSSAVSGWVCVRKFQVS